MKIKLSQSGGFAGENIQLKETSTEKITAADKARIESLLSEADFFNSTENLTGQSDGTADNLTYHLTITKSKKGTKTVSYVDGANEHSAVAKLIKLVKGL